MILKSDAMRLIANRIGVGLLTLLAVSAVVFAITSLLPGDAAQAMLGQEATPELLAALRAKFGLDQPGYVRYARWLGGMLLGDPGHALANDLPVAQLIGARLPNSLMLAAATTAVSVPVAQGIRVTSAQFRGTL
jgi:peptide/nickel transport system permease protein